MQVLQSEVGGEIEATRAGSRELSPDSLVGTRKRFQIHFLVGPSPGDPLDVGEEDALAAFGIPVLREGPTNNAYCIGKFAREISSTTRTWEVICNFDSQVESATPNVEWGWDSRTIEKVIQRDPVNGNPIVNAVGEPLLVTGPVSIAILTVDRIKDVFSPNEILFYENRTNSTTFYGAPPGCALLSSIKDSPIVIGGMKKRRITYIVEFDLSIDPSTGLMFGWAVQLLNHGTKYKHDAVIITTIVGDVTFPAYYTDFTDLFKNPTTGNLNLDGTARDPALPPIWLPFNRHARADLNALDLGPF